MGKRVLMVEACGFRQVDHGDGTISLTDKSTGITQRFYSPTFSPAMEPGACPDCGSSLIITHQIGGYVAGDQDYERVCMDCGSTLD
jgi:transposase-like protein